MYTQDPMSSQSQPPRPQFRCAAELSDEFPNLGPPVIHGLLREGETLNVIAPPKVGKSWLVTDAGLCIATGRPWLGCPVEAGKVLILDNELHPQTSADRIRKVAEAAGIHRREYADRLFVENLRGRLAPLSQMGGYFAEIDPGQFRVIILDAWYRFLEPGADENDNGAMAAMYNLLDHFAHRLGCAFVAIHHTSKGSQYGKAVTDVGAGAGSQSRAADTHAVLRPHEQPGCVVLEAATRSFPPPSPVCLRWDFPRWELAQELDPKRLHGVKPARSEGTDKKEVNEEDVIEVVRERQPVAHSNLIQQVRKSTGCSDRKATAIVRVACQAGLIVNEATARNTPNVYTLPGFSVCARTPHTPQGSAVTDPHVPCVRAQVRSHSQPGRAKAGGKKRKPRAKATR